MKTLKRDWILRLVRFNVQGEKEVKYIDIYTAPRDKVMEIANNYATKYKYDIVRIYKFDTLI